jgi:hypothetical protein
MDSISFAYNGIMMPIILPTAPNVYTNSFDPNKYAIMFTGDYKDLRWNDLSHMYSALKFNGFSDENIFVFVPQEAINWNPDLDHDGNNDFDDYCTYYNIESTLSNLVETLNEKDILLFYCSTHGDTVNLLGDVFLVLQNGEQGLADDELAGMVQDINCSEMIFLIDACYSGGFVSELEGNHRTIQTCTDYQHVMWIQLAFGYNFFTYTYGTALKGYHPYLGQPWSFNFESGAIGEQDLGDIWPE